jgi:hypothetical protein
VEVGCAIGAATGDIARRKNNDNGANSAHNEAEGNVASSFDAGLPEGSLRPSTRFTARLVTMRVTFDRGSKMASAMVVMSDRDLDGPIKLEASKHDVRHERAVYGDFVLQLVFPCCLFGCCMAIIDRLKQLSILSFCDS